MFNNQLRLHNLMLWQLNPRWVEILIAQLYLHLVGMGAEFTQHLSKSQRKKLKRKQRQQGTKEHGETSEHFEDAQPEPQHQSDGEFSEDIDHQESSVNEALVTAIVPFVSEVPLRCEVNISNNFSTLDSEDNVLEMQDELVREAGFVSGRWGDQVEMALVQLPVKRGRGRPKKGEDKVKL
ncbi:hypothetical protein IFM89_032896 [Coptis chinensis]|uniref:Uncharacterized protein n=1 Tax=Coptis chinensis TaxID=261450 RepID=A0A835IS64_9MAGN|nr:hypothetical protein IFM89_032896 [Coptis chinensis]